MAGRDASMWSVSEKAGPIGEPRGCPRPPDSIVRTRRKGMSLGDAIGM